MKKVKWKNFLAQLLIVFLLMPYVSTSATIIANNEDKLEESKVEEVTKEEQVYGNDDVTSDSNEGDESSDGNINKQDDKNEQTDDSQYNEAHEIIDDAKVEENLAEDAAKNAVVEVEENEESVVGEKYESFINTVPKSFKSTSTSIEEREEYRLKMEGASTLRVLKNKSDKPYEVALAYNDGSYSFLSSADSYDEAINIINNTEVSEEAVPAIIGSNGQVVYSPNSMARIWVHIDGKPYTGSNINTNLYTDSSLTKAMTYVNHSYVDDVPLLIDNGTSAKILVSGYEGWVNKNTSASQYDLVVVPINQAINPSYYFVEGGEIKHFISSNLTGSGGHTLALGKAPEYLKSGVKYLSYDGKYFYDGSNLLDGLNTLINDYKAGTRGNSVNANNPHYIYYLNLPFRSKTVYSSDDLNRFINNDTVSTSKLRNMGAALKDAEQKYGVNALLTLGVAMNESAKGTSQIAMTKNNLFGINAVDSNPGQAANEFATPQDSIYEFSKNYISRGYADPSDWRYYGGFLGNKQFGANVKYASDPFWGEKAARYAHEIDKYLSNGVSALKDTNVYQLAIATSNTKVVNKNNALLYNVTNNMSQYGAYLNTPFVITSLTPQNIGGVLSYAIYPERNTPINSGGSENKYHGNYDWFDTGYISTNGVTLINKAEGGNLVEPNLEIKAGSDRYATAVELSKSAFNSCNTIVLVNGLAFADGLTATPLATVNNAPLLLTKKDELPQVTMNEIKRLGAKNIIIVGGKNVIGNSVYDKLKSLGVNNIVNLGGSDRYETSLNVAKHIDSNYYDVEKVVVTNGLGEADALSIASVAGRDRMPIILSRADSVPKATLDWLSKESLATAFLIGGTTVLDNNVANQINSVTAQNSNLNRLGGANRYETNAMVISKFYGTSLDKVYITKGLELADALAAGPIAMRNNAPIVLSGSDLTKEQKDVLSQRGANTVIQAGYGVSEIAINTLKKCLGKIK